MDEKFVPREDLIQQLLAPQKPQAAFIPEKKKSSHVIFLITINPNWRRNRQRDQTREVIVAQQQQLAEVFEKLKKCFEEKKCLKETVRGKTQPGWTAPSVLESKYQLEVGGKHNALHIHSTFRFDGHTLLDFKAIRANVNDHFAEYGLDGKVHMNIKKFADNASNVEAYINKSRTNTQLAVTANRRTAGSCTADKKVGNCGQIRKVITVHFLLHCQRLGRQIYFDEPICAECGLCTRVRVGPCNMKQVVPQYSRCRNDSGAGR